MINIGKWTVVIRWLKFNAVGAVGIGVQLIVLAALRSGLHLNYLLATAFAVEAAVIHNFRWHERFTWSDRAPVKGWTRFVKFNLTAGLFSILGNIALMKLLVDAAHLQYLAANAIAIAACSIVNFLVSDKLVFRAHDSAPFVSSVVNESSR
jgi:putative flippase GtrA